MIALSPYSPEYWFLVYDQRRVKYALPASFANMIAPSLAEYQAAFTTVVSSDDLPGPGEALPTAAKDAPPPYEADSLDQTEKRSKAEDDRPA